MFAKSIVFQDDFLDMPMSSRCLYFSLSMVADDDGFVDSYRSVMRQIGATADDLRILLAKRYIIAFDTGVIVIRHWRINNYLRSDRYRETQYQEEMSQLSVAKTGEYVPSNTLCTTINAGKRSGIPDGIPLVCIEENSIEENSIEENIVEKHAEEERKEQYLEEIQEIIEYLNNTTNSRYSPKTEETKRLIRARIKDGRSVDDFKRVIDTKSKEWMGTDNEKYLRPITLFNASKFESYLNQKPFTVKQQKSKANTLSSTMTHEYDMEELRRRAKE